MRVPASHRCHWLALLALVLLLAAASEAGAAFPPKAHHGAQQVDQTAAPITGTTRQFTFAYNPSGATVGKLNTVTTTWDGSSTLVATTGYDELLRPQTVTTTGGDLWKGQLTTLGYDLRSRVKSVSQSYTTVGLGATSLVERDYDGYGDVRHEKVQLDGTVVAEFNQSWDSSGRRSALTSLLSPQSTGAPGSAAAFLYTPAGLMSRVSAGGRDFDSAYDTKGLLTSRTTLGRIQTVTARDTQGRATQISTAVYATTPLTENQVWVDRGQRQTYAATRAGTGSWSETRNYTYTSRGEIVVEEATPAAGTPGSFVYRFDFDKLDVPPVDAGLGVRTAAVWQVGANYTDIQRGSWLTFDPARYVAPPSTRGVDAFSRPTLEVDYPVSVNSGYGVNCAYDAAGHVVSRQYADASGIFHWQDLYWDAAGRLTEVDDYNPSTGDGFAWVATYDGLGRRLRTQKQAITAGELTGAITQIDSIYDPEVEFLEVAVSLNGGSRVWEVHGPDLNGQYGGLQGIGGLEATIDETTGVVTPVVNDAFGNVVGRVSSGVMVWNPVQAGGYGVLPGSTAPVLDATHSAADTLVWRSRRIDPTGLYYMGARYYEPGSGRFLSTDPLGFGSSKSLYDYAGGDPVNGLDPDGRMAAAALKAWDRDVYLERTLGREDSISTNFKNGEFSKYMVQAGADLSDPEVQFVLGAFDTYVQGVEADYHTQAVRNEIANTSSDHYAQEALQYGREGVASIPFVDSLSKLMFGYDIRSNRRGDFVTGHALEIVADTALDAVPLISVEKTTVRVGTGVLKQGAKEAAADVPIIIGENMARVEKFADRFGGETINDWLAGRQWTQELNDEFVAIMKAQGRKIQDIGPDFLRRLKNRANPARGKGPSVPYGTERKELLDYEKYERLFQRKGKYEGGVPGFDS
jgi:RHS repeat-associated protein